MGRHFGRTTYDMTEAAVRRLTKTEEYEQGFLGGSVVHVCDSWSDQVMISGW